MKNSGNGIAFSRKMFVLWMIQPLDSNSQEKHIYDIKCLI